MMISLLRVLALAVSVGPGLGLVVLAADPPAEPKDKPAVSKAAPDDVADLRAIQNMVKRVLKKAMPATVGIQIGPGSGSGVIVNADGLVMTAGHVSGEPGQKCTLILSDGRRIKGKTLGYNADMDSGMIQITDKGPWPFVKVGDSTRLKKGDWCVAVGHPNGYKPGRTPVVRVGRIQEATKSAIRTDCTLVGGDSGGPLFDLDGNVIGIHSRISWGITMNIHVPSGSFKEDWDRLVKGEKWGGRFGRGEQAYLGVAFDPESDSLKVDEIRKDTPADKAGLKAGDVLLSVDGKKLTTRKDLTLLLQKKKPGDEITVEVQRDDKTLKLSVKLAKRPA